MSTFRLIYASIPNVAFGTPEQMLDELLHAASVNNARFGVTGLLVADDSFFMQVLAGERQAVTDVFMKIAGDHRHGTIALLNASEETFRLFPNWSMAALGPSDTRSRLFARHRKSAAFHPHDLTAAEATRFFFDVAATARTYDTPVQRTIVFLD